MQENHSALVTLGSTFARQVLQALASGTSCFVWVCVGIYLMEVWTLGPDSIGELMNTSGRLNSEIWHH